MIYILCFLFSFAMASDKPSVLISLNPELPEQRVIYLEDVAEVSGLTESTKKAVEKIVLQKWRMALRLCMHQ